MQLDAFKAVRLALAAENERKAELTRIGVRAIGKRNFAWDGRDLERAYALASAAYEATVAKIGPEVVGGLRQRAQQVQS